MTGYGYSDVHCKDVEQETCYNSPELSEEIQPATVTVPEPEQVCVNKPVDVVRVTCDDITEEKCIVVPDVIEEEQTEQVCRTKLAAPNCQQVDIIITVQYDHLR